MTTSLSLTEAPQRLAKLGTAVRIQPQSGDIRIAWGDTAPAAYEVVEQDETAVTTGHEGDLWVWADDTEATLIATAWAAPNQPDGADSPSALQTLLDVNIGVLLIA